jgi:hypothetical protein
MRTAEGAWTTTRSLRNSLYGDLVWRRPNAMRRDMVLEAGSEQLALLRWEKLFSLQATAICADGRWLIGRHGVIALRTQVVVTDPVREQTIATFERHWRGTGVVRFAGGAEFRWTRSGFWRSRWAWGSDATESLIAFRSSLGFTRCYEMEVDPAAERVPEVPVLVMLGGYLMAVILRRGHAH